MAHSVSLTSKKEPRATIKHFSEIQWPPATLEEFHDIMHRTDHGRLFLPLFEQFLSELRAKGEGAGVWYDIIDTDDSHAPE